MKFPICLKALPQGARVPRPRLGGCDAMRSRARCTHGSVTGTEEQTGEGRKAQERSTRNAELNHEQIQNGDTRPRSVIALQTVCATSAACADNRQHTELLNQVLPDGFSGRHRLLRRFGSLSRNVGSSYDWWVQRDRRDAPRALSNHSKTMLVLMSGSWVDNTRTDSANLT